MSAAEQRKALQQEYDKICDCMIRCWKNNQMDGFEEYRARKSELEKASYLLELRLDRERDTAALLRARGQKGH